MAFCKYCGQENSENMKFCKNCGAQLETSQTVEPPGQQPPGAGGVCHSCGQPVQPGVKFCRNCGTRIQQDKTQSRPPEPSRTAGRVPPRQNTPQPEPAQNAPQGNKSPKPKSKKLILGLAAAVCSIFLLFMFIGGSDHEQDPLDDYFSDIINDDELNSFFGDEAQSEISEDDTVDYEAVLEMLDIADVFSQPIITAGDLKGPPMTEEERIEFIRESLASETDIDVSNTEVPLPPDNLNRESRIYGSLEEDGVEVQIPARAIDDNIQLEIVKTEDGGIDISAPGYEDGIMLWEPATIRMALSESVDENEYLNHAGIYEGKNGTETFPSTVDGLNNQVLEIQTTHFSKFYPRKHTNEECSEYFSEKFAGRHVDRDFALQTKEDHKKSIADIIAQGYEAIGIKDPELINYLAQQAAGEILGESITYNAASGDHVALADNASKTAVSTYLTYLNYCVQFADDMEKQAAIENSTYFAGNIGKYAMAAIKGGVTDGSLNGALEETMKTFATNIPAVKWGKMAADIAVVSRNMLTRSQAEDIYQLYEEAQDRESGGAHDSEFMDLISQRYRNYLSQCNIDAIEAYGGMPYHTFTEKYPDLARKICAHTQAGILKSLKNRYNHRTEKADLQHHYKAFIDSLFERNLIKKGDLNRAFNNGKFYSAEEYLDRMLYARRSILNMLGGDITRFGDTPEKQEKNLSWLAYMFLHSGNAGDGRMAVLQYLYRDATGRLQLRKTDEIFEDAKQYAEAEKKPARPSGENKETHGYWKHTGRQHFYYDPSDSKTAHQGDYASEWKMDNSASATEFTCSGSVEGNYWSGGTGRDEDNYNGSNFSIHASFSLPKSVYQPGEEVAVDVQNTVDMICGVPGEAVSLTSDGTIISHASYEEIVKHNCLGRWPGSQDLVRNDGKDVWTDHTKSRSYTIYGTMPELANPGDKICIRYNASAGPLGFSNQGFGSVWEYEWVE